jgi:DNA modification methylase
MNKLYNCAFQSVINELDFDIIITDPPYNIGFNYNQYADTMTGEQYIEMLSNFKGKPCAIIQYPEEMMRYVVPALGVPDDVLAWCYNSNINRRFRLINIYNAKPDFSKVKQPYKNPTDKRVKALIDNGSEGTNIYDWFSDIQLVKNVSQEKTIHPCPIPEKLIERLILLLTNEGDTVLDPFMGCGTVPAVCKKLNRDYIGCEIDPKYYNVATSRVNDIVTLSLF